MNVTLRAIVAAVPALSKLAAANLNVRTAHTLMKCTTALQAEADFFMAERQKIVAKYGETHEDGTCTYSKENEQKAMDELTELLDMTVNPKVEKVKIPLSEDLKLSVNDLELLTPFILFVDKEE